MKLAIMFYLNKPKASPKTGKIPLYVRVTLNRQKAEARLNIEIWPTEIEKWDSRVMRFTDRTMTANSLLTKIEGKFEDFRHHNATQLSEFSVKAIRDIIIGTDTKPSKKIIAYLDEYYQTTVNPNGQMADGTKRNYRKAITHLKQFLSFRKTKDAVLKDVDTKFANEFKDFLLNTNERINRIGMKECIVLPISFILLAESSNCTIK